jgi:protease-4
MKIKEIWACTPEQIAETQAGYQMAKVNQEGISISDFITPRKKIYAESDNVAVISVTGSLTSNAPAIHEKLGNTTYESIKAETDDAVEGGARAIVYKINSGGGAVLGLQEVTSKIKGLDVPTYAFVDGVACSAAYDIANASDAIVSNPSSISGNIGCVMAMIDSTGYMDSMGFKQVVLTNEGADLKGIGREEMTDSQREFLQDQVNVMGEAFQGRVLSKRPDIDAEVFRAGWYDGEKSLEMGLIDGVGTFEQLLSRI